MKNLIPSIIVGMGAYMIYTLLMRRAAAAAEIAEAEKAAAAASPVSAPVAQDAVTGYVNLWSIPAQKDQTTGFGNPYYIR